MYDGENPLPFVDLLIVKNKKDISGLVKDAANQIGLAKDTDKAAATLGTAGGIVGTYGGALAGAALGESMVDSSEALGSSLTKIGGGIAGGAVGGGAVGAAVGTGLGFGIGTLGKYTFDKILQYKGAYYQKNLVLNGTTHLDEKKMKKYKINQNPVYLEVIRRQGKKLTKLGGSQINPSGNYLLTISRDIEGKYIVKVK